MRGACVDQDVGRAGHAKGGRRCNLGFGARKQLVTRGRRYRALPSGAAWSTQAPGGQGALDLLVAWHDKPLGRLAHDGCEWRRKPTRRAGPTPVRETTPGKPPALIETLLPEGWLAQMLHDREAVRRGHRYMSDITVVSATEDEISLPQDILASARRRLCRSRTIQWPLRGSGARCNRGEFRAEPCNYLRPSRSAGSFGRPDQGTNAPRSGRLAFVGD